MGANSYSKKKSFTWFPTSRDRVESTALLRDMKKKGQGRGRRQRFLVALSKKGMQATMESPGYLLVTTTTLTRRLAYLRQAMATLHVVYASISILLDMGGARLIRDWGATKILSKWTPY